MNTTAEEQLTRAKKYLQAGNLDSSIHEARALLSSDPNNVNALYILSVSERYAGHHRKALESLARLLTIQSDYAAAYQERGHNFRELDELGQAAEAYRIALEHNDMLLASWRGLVKCLRSLDRLAEVRDAELKLEAIESLPVALQSSCNLFNEGYVSRAETLCRKYLLQNPRDVNGIRLLAKIGASLNALEDAELLLSKCLEFTPGFIAAQVDLLTILQRRHKYREALDLSTSLLESSSDNLSFLSLHAKGLGLVGRFEEAIICYEKMMHLGTRNAMVLMSYGHALKTVGRFEEAVTAYRSACEDKPEFGDAYWSLANLKTFRFTDTELEKMQETEARPGLDIVDRFHLCFALGKAYEDCGNVDQSFKFYARGNTLKNKSMNYSPEKIAKEVQAQIDFFTAELVEKKRGLGNPSNEPVFVVGMPRAGSTLVEQILASHSMVDGTKELPNIIAMVHQLKRRQGKNKAMYPDMLADLSPDDFYNLGKKYINDTKIQRQGRARFLDKMPNNFRHIGFILLILPNAKIIDIRRDSISCCFSNYKQLYAEGQYFSYSFDDLALYYSDYVRLMDHWDRIFPGRILRVQYADLIEDFENQVKTIIEFCDLDYEEACLEFHKTKRNVRTASSEQVRQPINRKGLDDWRAFTEHLGPLQKALDNYCGQPGGSSTQVNR